jgi:hypothetical protein
LPPPWRGVVVVVVEELVVVVVPVGWVDDVTVPVGPDTVVGGSVEAGGSERVGREGATGGVVTTGAAGPATGTDGGAAAGGAAAVVTGAAAALGCSDTEGAGMKERSRDRRTDWSCWSWCVSCATCPSSTWACSPIAVRAPAPADPPAAQITPDSPPAAAATATVHFWTEFSPRPIVCLLARLNPCHPYSSAA